MHLLKIIYKYNIYFIVLVLASISMFFMMHFDWLSTHDDIRYPILLSAFHDVFVHGFLYPRWLPDFYKGYGYPTFVFYQPGIFFISLPCLLLGIGEFASLKISIFILFVLSYFSIFQLCKLLTKDVILSYFLLFMYFLTPYLYVELNVRGDLSELSAMLLTPLPLFFIKKLLDSENRKARIAYTITASLAITMIIYMHILVCIFYFPFVLIFTIASIRNKQELSSILFELTAIFSAALLFSAPYWLNGLMMRQFININIAFNGYYTLENHFVYPLQLFSNFWGNGTSNIGIQNDGMSFQLGLIHFLLATIGFVVAVKNKHKLVFSAYLYYLFLIIMMTPLSMLLWYTLPVIQMMQFPWRLLSVTAIVQIICMTALKDLSFKYRNLLMILFMILSVLWYHKEFSALPYSKTLESEFNALAHETSFHYVTETATNEFAPLTSRPIKAARGLAPLLQVSSEQCTLIKEKDSNKSYIHYSLDTPNPLTIRINQYYFPGWSVIINGKRIDDKVIFNNLSQSRLIQLALNKGKYEIKAWYDGPLGWKYIAFMPLIGVVLFAVFLFLSNHKKKSLYDSECDAD